MNQLHRKIAVDLVPQVPDVNIHHIGIVLKVIILHYDSGILSGRFPVPFNAAGFASHQSDTAFAGWIYSLEFSGRAGNQLTDSKLGPEEKPF